MKKILCALLCVVLLVPFIPFIEISVFAKTDEELIASNEIEFFVTEADGSWWNVTYPANGTIGNKYLNEIIEGVQLRGIRIDKVSDFRYQLIPETQEQKDLICGYKTVDDILGIRQVHKLQAFLNDVDSPTANARIEAEQKQAEERKQADRTELGRKSTNRWADVINSYVYDNGNNTFNVVDYNNKEITVSTYNNDYSLLETKSIPFELDKFGGFYSGKKYNYIAFGQNNDEESNSKEVIRIIKYDKNFNRIAQVSVTDCYTTEPFNAGSLRMCENGNTLFIHTSRKRYLSEDGLRHQSQLTIILDTDKMTVENDLGAFQPNHVSHSFNQFAIYDGENFVLLDLGDAYPRSVVLNKYEGMNPEEWLSEYYGRAVLKYTPTNLFVIPGEIGANCTGVMVGGFDYSDKNYLVAMNKTDHSKVTEYTSYEMKGLDYDERDIVLLVSSKDNTDISKVKQVRLTNYIGKQQFGSKPYLVKLSNDRFLVLWEELEYITPTKRDGNRVTYVTTQGSSSFTESSDYGPTKCTSNGVKYVQVNGDGEIISDIRTRNDIKLSGDCQPTLIGNDLMWYIDGQDGRKFYTLDLNTALITVKLNGQLVNFDQPPTIIDGRTLVPLRAIFEALGATVEWNSETQTVTSKRGSTSVSLSIDSKTMYKNGKAVTLDVPAQLINDRTLVPARAIAEAFGCDVDWDSDTKTVIIKE
uniref:Copper amine oxidase-like N-terminal domain-containing protein n=1 Tax=uncultured Bacillota bacterium TaxID=344338 RepID=A0A650EQ69_9FIRM|nr:hypothetical protein Firmicute1046_1600 [uncultured Firmicutes bacterium]